MTRVLRRISLFTGFAILAISIQFSYDGFDQSVNGVNDGYTTLAIGIGYTLAIVFSVIEFIFGTSYRELNWTLRGIGIFAYVYSIYTNYLGIKHVLGTSEFIAWSMAFVMDVYPEPAIAWALGEALTGDLFGNLGKMIFGTPEKPVEHQDIRHGNKEKHRNHDNLTNNPALQSFLERNRPEKHGVSGGKLASPIFNDKYTNHFKNQK
jgi:hypothetical protein